MLEKETFITDCRLTVLLINLSRNCFFFGSVFLITTLDWGIGGISGEPWSYVGEVFTVPTFSQKSSEIWDLRLHCFSLNVSIHVGEHRAIGERAQVKFWREGFYSFYDCLTPEKKIIIQPKKKIYYKLPGLLLFYW